MIKFLYIIIFGFLVSCSNTSKPPEGRAQRLPDIAQSVIKLNEPTEKVAKAHVALEKEINLLESHKTGLLEDQERWRKETKSWGEKNLSDAQKLDKTVQELSRVRANWFKQLESSTLILRRDLNSAHTALSDLNKEKQKLLIEASKHDRQSKEDNAHIKSSVKKISELDKEIKSQERKLNRRAFLLKFFGLISLISGVYLIARLVKLTPQGRIFLFWLP